MLAELLPDWVRDVIWIGGVVLMFGAAIGSAFSWRSIRSDVDTIGDNLDRQVADVHTRLDKAGIPGAGKDYDRTTSKPLRDVPPPAPRGVAPQDAPTEVVPAPDAPVDHSPTGETDAALTDLKAAVGLDTTPPRVRPPIPVPGPVTVSYALAPPKDETARRFRPAPQGDPTPRFVSPDVPTPDQQADPTRPNFEAQPGPSRTSGSHAATTGRNRGRHAAD